MPSSRQARMILSAISPRFATRTLPITYGPPTRRWAGPIRASRDGTALGLRLEAEERLVVLDAAGVLVQNLDYLAGDVGDDLVHHLHRLDDAENLPGLDGVPHLDVGLLARGGRPVKRADERRADRVQAVRLGDDLGRFGDRDARGRGRRGGGRRLG